MSTARFLGTLAILAVALGAGTPSRPALAADASAGGLLSNGDFSLCKKSADIRKFKKTGWYESRKDGKGHLLAILSTKAVAGDATPKAMVKASSKLNTYLTQEFGQPQTGDFEVSYDILIKQILPPANRSAFFMIGDNSDKKDGPNSTGSERFVFAGFENAAEKGKVNLFAREGSSGWDKKTAVASGIDLDKWYRITVTVHTAAGTYDMQVAAVAGQQSVTPHPVTLKAFSPNGKWPKKLTAVSFASWNDGPGTFYIDNVTASSR